MTIDEMFNELENKDTDTLIVTLKYRYDFEEYYTIENHILDYDCLDDSYVWLSDWYEGQTDVEVLGYMRLGDVDTTNPLTCEDCISRQATIDAIYKKHIGGKDAVENAPINDLYACGLEEAVDAVENMPSVTSQQKNEDMGEVSDGYHTFNQLYHQRAILFATIVNQNKDRAWKSYKHEDGKYCFDKDGEWFIVGIDTPKGSYTYHYSKEYWDYFDCEELECGKPWDGHTEEDVIRLLSLTSVTPQPKVGEWKYVTHYARRYRVCSECNAEKEDDRATGWDFCPNCGSYNGGGDDG